MASLAISIPERGHLQETPLPRILLELYGARFNGGLRLTRERVEKEISLLQGAPVASTSNLPSESLGVQLMDSGKLSRTDYSKLRSYVERQSCTESVALLSLKLLEPKGLFAALKNQFRRHLADCFAWAEGCYELLAEDTTSQGTAPFRTDPYRLVHEGLTAHWSPDRMLLGLADQMVRYPRPTRALAGVVERLQLDGTSRQLLSGLSGRDTLGKALAPVLSSSQALAAVWVLDAARLLNYSEQSVRDATNMDMEEDLDTEIEISILGSEPNEAEQPAPDSDRAPTAPPRRDAGPGDRDASPPASAEAQALREEVLEHLKQLDDLNYYGLLDVTPDAATGAIRKAYFSAAKRYHPDALARLGLNDIKEEAARVFARMAEANETLSDKNKRAEYDASLETDEPAIDTARLAQAETFFRKGEILTNMGDFKGALEYLRPAVELWPDEATYQSTLAWAYYKKRPAEPDKALVHLRKALALDPDDSVSQFRLGLVERALAS